MLYMPQKYFHYEYTYRSILMHYCLCLKMTEGQLWAIVMKEIS